MRLRVGSLFTGCMGLDLGLESTGAFEIAWGCETDPACRRVVERHRPELTVHADARHLADAEPVDVLAGGFPCQDLSYAGRRAGLDGNRSALWFAMADAVRLLRPRLVLVENVPGLAIRGFGRVLYDLAAVGYVGSWLRLRASDVGAPHERERIFILARATADADGDLPRRDGRALPHAQGTRAGRVPQPQPRARVTADAGRERLDRREERTRTRGRAGLASDREAPTDTDRTRRQGTRPPEPDGGRLAPRDFGIYAAAVERWERTLGRPAPRPIDDRGRLEPVFVEWMLGFPHDWTAGESRTARLRMLGNAVQVQVGQLAGRLLLEEGTL